MVNSDKPVASTKPAPKPAVIEPKEEKPAPKPVETSKLAGIQPRATESGVVFLVQLFAIKGDPKKSEYDKLIKLFGTVSTETIDGGIIRYFTGNEKHYADAKALQEKAVADGYKDAFVAGYKDGRHMGPNELKAAETR